MACIHAVAAILLWTSGLEFSVKLLGSLLLLVQGGLICKTPSPGSPYATLEYNQKQWALIHQQGSIQLFSSHRVLIDARLFFVLHLSNKDLSSSFSTKTLVVFFDQISRENYRTLRILEKID